MTPEIGTYWHECKTTYVVIGNDGDRVDLMILIPNKKFDEKLFDEDWDVPSYFEDGTYSRIIEAKELRMDDVDHPEHFHPGTYEAIKVIEAWGLDFCLGNTVKYISRSGRKDDRRQDLEKALWYLQRKLNIPTTVKSPLRSGKVRFSVTGHKPSDLLFESWGEIHPATLGLTLDRAYKKAVNARVNGMFVMNGDSLEVDTHVIASDV